MSNYSIEYASCTSLPWSALSIHINKRERHSNLDAPMILSECHGEEDCFHPMAKRFKYQETPLSPGAVSMSTVCTDQDQEMLERQEHVVEWWKKKPAPETVREPSMSGTATLCCFLCNQPSPSPVTPSFGVQNEKAPKTNSNSLLKYFSTSRATTSIGSCSSLSPQQHLQSKLSSCCFCERQACVTCSAICQECQHRFCTLCTTKDYSSTVERSFCLDCAHPLSSGDAMAIE